MTNEIDDLRRQVRLLSERVDALSLVLHATIIVANCDIDDLKGGIAQLLKSFAPKQDSAFTRSIMMEWTDVLNGIERPLP